MAGLSNPKGVVQQSPGLPRQRLPWVRAAAYAVQPQRGCEAVVALGAPLMQCLHNPVGVERHARNRLPRVAPAAQPWALLHNPFGVELRPTHRIVRHAHRVNIRIEKSSPKPDKTGQNRTFFPDAKGLTVSTCPAVFGHDRTFPPVPVGSPLRLRGGAGAWEWGRKPENSGR